MTTHADYFGNVVTYFAMQGSHKRLTVRARSLVALQATSLPSPSDTPPWEAVADRTAMPLEALEFLFDSALIPAGAELAAYARAAFPPGRPLLDAVLELTRRIHEDFTFDPEATTIATPLADVFTSRRGVCQDFARLEIACLRSLGLPARYVSGYLETVPPPGRSRLLGADASHAWLAVYCPESGWIHVDPTNNLLPSCTHVTVAWGRDYNDVSPIHGVILGGGKHTLRVSVDVLRLAER
jgi:transglutaminase-like putative cysteine protease